ncbi:response regulator [Pseudomonas sp. T8]|uniref:response regulator n=1 Tax=Pseudomonas sp. T8 TaxID=645292 RepID=UPI002149197B|nr:response regulator [Pseudomonas sp. T8]UUT23015.1 response regulator [Pseudomonas sp. T8]
MNRRIESLISLNSSWDCILRWLRWGGRLLTTSLIDPLNEIRVDWLFRLVATIVLVVTISGAGLLLVRDWKAYKATKRTEELLQIVKAALSSSEYLSAERGPMNGMIGASQSDEPDLRVALDLARTRSDAALDLVVQKLKASSCESCERATVLMALVAERVRQARKSADRLMAIAREERSTRAVEHAITRMFQLIEDMNHINDSVIFELVREGPAVAEYVITARLAAELREQAGRAGSLFTPALTSRRALSEEELERLWIVFGRIHTLGDLVESSRFEHLSDDSSGAVVEQMRKTYFGLGIAYLRQTVLQDADDASFPTASSFAQHYVPLMQPITSLRDVELDAAIQVVEKRTRATYRVFGFLAGATVTIILSMVYILVLFSRRIIRPISAATDSVLNFSSGNYSAPADSFKQKDNIGALLAALQTLGGVLVRNGELEAERSTLVEQLRRAVDDSQIQARLLEEAKDEAVASSESKGKFLAMMSHEIRTPMNGLLGLLEILRSTILDARQRQYLEVANGSAKALMQTLNDILEYTMIDAGALVMTPAPTDLREVIDEVMAALAGSGRNKRLEMEVYVHPSVAATYLADASRLRQVLLSLLSNAIKFTSQGRVGISVDLGKVEGAKQQVVLTVYDTGIGISEVARKGLFLEQFDGALARRFDGMGVSLVISKRLVEMMGGTMEISSIECLGTSVILKIDLVAECNQYEFPELGGRVILIGTEKAHVAKALRAFALAAGMEPQERQLCALDRGLPTLYVSDAEDIGLGQPGHALLIERSNSLRSGGISGTANYWANPPNWRLFVAGCQEAIATNINDGAAYSGLAGSTLGWLGAVMVVDDNPVNCLVLTNQLKHLGCETVLACSDGEEAWDAFLTKKVRLLITDVYMSKLDGIELVSRVRAAESASDRYTLIVAITASVLEETERRCRDAGVDLFLTKPVSLNQLRHALTQLYMTRRGL